jgi:hypothetical protein
LRRCFTRDDATFDKTSRVDSTKKVVHITDFVVRFPGALRWRGPTITLSARGSSTRLRDVRLSFTR